MKILIVDDKEEERYLSETLLKRSGYEVVSATNGAEALEKLRAEGFDMIVSDILMPVMDGFQLCKKCKEDEKLRDIPFVFYTGEYLDEQDKNLAIKLRADRFIQKPIEPDEFIKVIQGVFRDLEEAKKKPAVAGMKILIVEDNEDSRNLLIKQLRAYGHEVMAAADGAEALEQALAEIPDIILSDIMMPNMDGYQLCQQCKQNDKLRDIPFVFYTATYTKEEDEKLGLSLGANGFILKPTEPDVLVQMLSEIVEKAQSGALTPPKAPLEQSLFLSEYTKRIVAKLEDKVAELEMEITERKRAEEAKDHLYLMLRTIRNVNQLIVKEKNRDGLLKGICGNFTETRGCNAAWIVLLDESGGLITTAESGWGKDFLPMVRWLKQGELPDCGQRALLQSTVVVTEESSSTCTGCPLAKGSYSRGTMTARLEHNGKVYGLLSANLPATFITELEECSLFEEAAGDIAFALHNIELEEERKRLEHSLKERVKELQCLYNIASIVEEPGITLDKIYQEVVNLLPQSWQYPEITCARITIGDKEFKARNYAESQWKQSSDIKIGGTKAGSVEVGYLEERPEIDEGPFLKEERLLIDAVAERLGSITERKEAEEEFENIFNLSSDMVGVFTTEGRLIRVNPSWETILGYKAEELLKMGWDTLVHPDDVEKTNKEVEEQLNGNPVVDFTNRYKCKDGSYKTLEWRATFAKEGIVYATARDITERNKAEEMLKENQAKLKLSMKSAREGMWEWDFTTDRAYFDDVCLEMLGYKPGEIQNTAEWWWTQWHPDDVAPTKKAVKDYLEGRAKKYSVEFRLRNKSDKYVWISSNGVVLRKGKNNKPLYMIGIHQDITERKQAEEELKRSEERWRSLVENAPNIILIVDSSGVIQFINRTVAGIHIQDMIGKNHYDFIQPEYHDMVRKTIMEVLETGKPGSYVIAGVGPHGKMAWYETQVGYIKHEGQPAFAILVTADITERKRMEAKAREVETLRELDRMRSGLLANVSHELRTPLTSIKGFATTLLRSDVKWSEEEQRDFLQSIDQESDRLVRIISDLLDMSRLEAGELKLEKDNYRISEILDSVSSRLASLTEHQQLQVMVPSELPSVFVDEMRIGQVLTNLVENAAKFSPESSEITIEAKLAGDEIILSVIDRGQGITSELLGRVFDRFYQAESIVSGRKSGTGLGLSICKGIMESHGGRIWVESKPGEGSKFSFSLPVGKEEGEIA